MQYVYIVISRHGSVLGVYETEKAAQAWSDHFMTSRRVRSTVQEHPVYRLGPMEV